MTNQPAARWQRPVVWSFFGLLLGLGLLLYRGYGVSFDEAQSRSNGMVTLKYLAESVAPGWVAADPAFAPFTTPLPEYVDRDYGIFFETPASLLERLLHIDDAGDQFRLRHLLTFLTSLLGVGAVYLLGKYRFGDWRLGLLGATWLVLSPRLFAESFYNDKDVVFMSLFAVSTYTLVRFVARPSWRWLAWHAVACAATIDVRIMGVLLPVATVALLGLRMVRRELPVRATAAAAAGYVALLVGVLVLCWPYLWPAPSHLFMEAFAKMQRFRWEGFVFYQAAFVKATDLPWHYAPVWIGITTPLLYLGAFGVGSALIIITLLRRHWRLWHTENEMIDLLLLGLTVAPVLAVIVLHSVLYDGWRQLYFVYPSLLLVALRGWVGVWRWSVAARYHTLRVGLGAGTALALGTTLVEMARNHPFENVYFNELAGSADEPRYELDYWGLSFRKGLEYIAAHDQRPHIRVCPSLGIPGKCNLQMLPAADQARLQLVGTPEEADYFITNYRDHPEPYAYPAEAYQLRAYDRRILSVFRLHW